MVHKVSQHLYLPLRLVVRPRDPKDHVWFPVTGGESRNDNDGVVRLFATANLVRVTILQDKPGAAVVQPVVARC